MSAVHIKQTDDGAMQFVDSGGKVIFEIGFTDADPDQTYFATVRADGTKAYTTVDTGTTLDTTATKP
jgi:arginyl-tRNA synthetase